MGAKHPFHKIRKSMIAVAVLLIVFSLGSGLIAGLSLWLEGSYRESLAWSLTQPDAESLKQQAFREQLERPDLPAWRYQSAILVLLMGTILSTASIFKLCKKDPVAIRPGIPQFIGGAAALTVGAFFSHESVLDGMNLASLYFLGMAFFLSSEMKRKESTLVSDESPT